MSTDQQQHVSWRKGVPVSDRFDDPFYSLEDGWAESRHVFFAGNELPQRLRDEFHIAELGFGTGLNLALVLSHWAGPGRVHYTSFEAFPMAPEDARHALSRFDVARKHADVVADLLVDDSVTTDVLNATLIVGDARQTLPAWQGFADAWFLDGFSPARNPELWGEALMSEVAQHTNPKGTFATYTAAGHVRRALEAAGFEVERVAGFGRKRHMSRGILR